jgi:2,3-bisphosphoglycerate-independent phosphoglycerate mutase
MVGHTGVFAATVEAVETVDSCLGGIVEATLAAGGALLVTADHGNAEEMVDRTTGGLMTAHTTNPVPIIIVTTDYDSLRNIGLRDGAVLCAIAPTVLELMGLTAPPEMSEPSLLNRVTD